MQRIDPFNDDLLSLAEAARSLPNRPNISTVFRWIRDGVQGVTLDAVSIGGRWMTTRDALAAFIEQSTQAAKNAPRRRRQRRTGNRPPSARRAMQHADAERELAERGM